MTVHVPLLLDGWILSLHGLTLTLGLRRCTKGEKGSCALESYAKQSHFKNL